MEFIIKSGVFVEQLYIIRYKSHNGFNGLEVDKEE
jgi:hypothetical protein